MNEPAWRPLLALWARRDPALAALRGPLLDACRRALADGHDHPLQPPVHCAVVRLRDEILAERQAEAEGGRSEGE